jgi:hypothetical protein
MREKANDVPEPSTELAAGWIEAIVAGFLAISAGLFGRWTKRRPDIEDGSRLAVMETKIRSFEKDVNNSSVRLSVLEKSENESAIHLKNIYKQLDRLEKSVNTLLDRLQRGSG